MRQPDIEIYLRDASQEAVGEWLTEAIGPCSARQQKGQTFKCNAAGIPVTWLPKAVGKWHCLLLESDATPWADDLACARAASGAGCGNPLRAGRLAGKPRKRPTAGYASVAMARRDRLAHGLIAPGS